MVRRFLVNRGMLWWIPFATGVLAGQFNRATTDFERLSHGLWIFTFWLCYLYLKFGPENNEK